MDSMNAENYLLLLPKICIHMKWLCRWEWYLMLRLALQFSVYCSKGLIFNIKSQSYKNWRKLISGVREALLRDAGTIVSITDIPETSEDISPYATFQLSGPGGDPSNTLLHSFMYHEQAMTEGCASPPPTGVSSNHFIFLMDPIE